MIHRPGSKFLRDMLKGIWEGDVKEMRHDSEVKQIVFLMGVGVYPAPAGITFLAREKSNK
jgi:hypothetical protein